tara:strand:+ start:356 stop:511 length:156 start_codon:yes stop_codon:yes gene_type:complete
MFKSEKIKHPMLHHKRNLIIVCEKCHSIFHRVKEEARKDLVIERNLIELFK